MDLTIISARIYTGDPARPWAEALAVKDNRIVVVGRKDEVQKACPAGTRALELPGRLITPGLVDAHCHFGFLGLNLQMVDLRNQASLAACREKIKAAAAASRPGEWILGRGWNQFQWEEKREPLLTDLDDITPNNPAMMVRACGHTVWVNSLALERAGVTRDTPDPPGGRIERDPKTGRPNGLLKEARHVIEKAIPAPTPDDWQKAFLTAQQEALRFGLTGVHSLEGLRQWEALNALEKQGELKIRVHHAVQWYELKKTVNLGIAPSSGSDRLWIGPVKLYADGSLGSGTALLHEPYADEPGQRGLAVLSLEDLMENIAAAYKLGYDVAIHAIGDKAVTDSLTALSGARQDCPRQSRDRIEHVQLLRPEDISLFQDLGAVASVQPVFLPTDWSVAEAKWGQDRCRSGGYIWKSIMQAGIPTQFGSDAPVESNNPLLGLQAAVTRQTLDGQPPGGWFPEQNLALEQGLAGYTRTSAWTSRRENYLGSITPGKWADLTVFEADLFQIPPEQWPSVGVEMTIVDGEIAFQKEAVAGV